MTRKFFPRPAEARLSPLQVSRRSVAPPVGHVDGGHQGAAPHVIRLSPEPPFTPRETEAQRAEQLAQVHTAESRPTLSGQRPECQLTRPPSFPGGSPDLCLAGRPVGPLRYPACWGCWGGAACSPRTARHPPREPAGEGSVSHCARPALSGQQGRALGRGRGHCRGRFPLFLEVHNAPQW